METPAYSLTYRNTFFFCNENMQICRNNVFCMFVWTLNPPSLTHTRVVTRQPVTVTTGAPVTAHGVVTLVLTLSVASAALVHICQSQTHMHTVSQSGGARDSEPAVWLDGAALVGGVSGTQRLSVGQKLATLSFEHSNSPTLLTCWIWNMKLYSKDVKKTVMNAVWWVTELDSNSPTLQRFWIRNMKPYSIKKVLRYCLHVHYRFE